MKKLLSLLLGLLIVSSLLASFLDETKTMDATVFGALFDAIDYDNGHDEVMRFYWDKLVDGASPNPTSRYEGEDDWSEERADYEPINWASTYAKNSLIGALAVEILDPDAEQYLIYAEDYLLDSSSDHYLKLYSDYPGEESVFGQDIDGNGIWEDGEFSDGSWNDCLYYGRLILNVAFIVDMLWDYVDSDDKQLLDNKLTELAGWADILLNDLTFDVNGGKYARNYNNPNYPYQLWTRYHNGRIRLAGGLGYAGCVLENEDYVKTAEDDLFEWDVPGDQTGFLPYMTTNSGLYSEGMQYAEFTFRGLTYFFVARKRLTFDFSYIENNIDWFSDERVRQIYINSLDMVSPNLGWISFDDVIMNSIGSNSILWPPKYTFSEMDTYFYNSPEYDTEVRDHIKWLINSYDTEYSCYSVYWNTNKLYAFNEDPSRILGCYGSIPEHLENGTFSNEETTILRRKVNSVNDFTDYPVLVVNHENSQSRTAHEHSDQSSFILYYKGKQLLIDPGYRPSNASYYIGKEWLASAYAHNLIMVNPHDQFYNQECYWEDSELEEDYWNPLFHYEGQYILGTIIDYWNNMGEIASLGSPNNYEFNVKGFEPIGQSGEWDDNEPKNQAIKKF
ncbi:MAG: heparinase II/III-family protein, partial [Bacteroidales bacterium]|nr:heparinase II/III-family protein [Bacteroidales bacterium]